MVFVATRYQLTTLVFNKMAAQKTTKDSCIFCKIADKKENKELLYEDEEFVCFRDIKPATKHHYLVIPRKHMPEAKYLKDTDVPMIERMIQVGMDVVKSQGGDVNDVRTGFHWPPFTTVDHLHLHCISATSEMGFFNRNVVFKPNSFMFATSDWAIDYLKRSQL